MNTDQALCGHCKRPIHSGEEESCWYCNEYLCFECWELYGCCVHPEADAINEKARKVEVIRKPRTKAYRDAYRAANVSATVQHRIWELRKERGWSQAELARRMGTSQNAISRLEQPTDHLITMRTLVRLANAFDVSLELTLGEPPQPEP